MNIEYPFSAVTGQAQFKLALLLVATNPAIGGVLISGPRGSAKSTLARALADVLKKISPDNPASFVTLPLGATEEMLIGSLDLQQVLNDRQVAFNPGLLAKANGGILYVDEANLLADSLVDLLLDVAVSGVNRVERDGISHEHESRFVLVGTMNPDEGDLRPQLQDRFGLFVNIANHYSIEERVEIVQRREAFDQSPEIFHQHFQKNQQELIDRIRSARARLSRVSCAITMRTMIAARCADANVEGLRADIVWLRAAMAHAALDEREQVLESDLNAVEDLVLNHRRQSDSTSPPDSGSNDSNRRSNQDNNELPEINRAGEWGEMPAQVCEALEPVQWCERDHDRKSVAKNTQIDVSEIHSKRRGCYSKGKFNSVLPSSRINWFSTCIANYKRWPPTTLHFRTANTGSPKLHLILLDCSSSTIGHQLINHAKSIVLGIAQRVYLSREQLQILTFRSHSIDEALRRRRAPKVIRACLDSIKAGGGTPLRDALIQARDLLINISRKIPGLMLQTYLITDGRSRQSIDDIRLPGKVLLIDTEHSSIKRGRGKDIASSLCAEYIPMPINAG